MIALHRFDAAGRLVETWRGTPELVAAQPGPGARLCLDPSGATRADTHYADPDTWEPVARVPLAATRGTSPDGWPTLTWPETVAVRVRWSHGEERLEIPAGEPLELASDVPDTTEVELDVPHRGRWEVRVP